MGRGVLEDVAPGVGDIERGEYLAGAAVRDLEHGPLVASVAAATFTEVERDTCCRAAQLVGEIAGTIARGWRMRSSETS